MTRFLLALLVVLVLAYAGAVASSWSDWSNKSAFAPALWTLIAAPLLGAYFSAQLVTLVRRPRWFDRRAFAGIRCLFVGVATGLISIAGGALFLVYRPDMLPEWAAFGAAGGLATGAILLLLPRHRAGTCVRCSYDLRATLGPTCPECGGHHTAA